MADSSVDGLRQEPVGEDTKGNLYYYFSFNNEDCRLYRQEPPFKKSAKRRRSGGEDAQWETVCTTVEEMADFVESLSAARYADHLVQPWHDHTHICTYLVYTSAQPVVQPSFVHHARQHVYITIQLSVHKSFSSPLSELCLPQSQQYALLVGMARTRHCMISLHQTSCLS